jgi:hypothetical protein
MDCLHHTPDGDLQGVKGAAQLYDAYATAFAGSHFENC